MRNAHQENILLLLRLVAIVIALHAWQELIHWREMPNALNVKEVPFKVTRVLQGACNVIKAPFLFLEPQPVPYARLDRMHHLMALLLAFNAFQELSQRLLVPLATQCVNNALLGIILYRDLVSAPLVLEALIMSIMELLPVSAVLLANTLIYWVLLMYQLASAALLAPSLPPVLAHALPALLVLTVI